MKKLITTAAVLAGLWGSAPAMAEVDLEFYFPVAVGGKAADTIEALTKDYLSQTPGVQITPVYAGSYQDASAKAMTAARGGSAPQISLLLSTEMFRLIDEDLIEPFDDYVSEAEKDSWIGGFYEAFMQNSQTGGKTWGIPFQRSTPVMYYNKAAFAAAGLDPEQPPKNWDELVDFGKKLTKKDANGKVTQWGLRIPSSGFPYWLFQGLAAPNGAILANATGDRTFFDDPAVVEAAQFLSDLSQKHNIMAPGLIEWGATPKAFFEGEVAIIWTTTGNLTNIRTNAPFDFGVAMLPAKKRRGAPTGGGNFYLFKDSTAEEKQAAVDFVKWMTAPTQAAKWSIATGYVAPRPDAWETPAMKAYVQEVPFALVARDQLDFAVAELSTYENARIMQIFSSALEAIITGEQKPEVALSAAQAEAEGILKRYR